MHIPPDLVLGESGTTIASNCPVFIIAEVGINHQGDINIAKKLIEKAKEVNADCVKFQKSCLKEKFTQNALNRSYLNENSWGSTYGEHKQHLEFSESQFLELQEFARKKDILFSSSAMDVVSLKFLDSINVPFIKIGSGDSNNVLLLDEAAKLGKPLIISTGMTDMRGVDVIYKRVGRHHKELVLLHCVSGYPTPPEEANLGVIGSLRTKYPEVHIGYSGHEMGYSLTLAAVALGARVIERHITLDKCLKGSDHKCSLDVEEFREMVKGIREVEKGLGDVRMLLPCEEPCWNKLGKTVVARRAVEAGSILTVEDVNIKVSEPRGLLPDTLDRIVGAVVKRDIAYDEPITLDDIAL